MHSLTIIQERNDNLFMSAPANENHIEWSGFYRCMRETDRLIRQCENNPHMDLMESLITKGRP